MKGNFGKVGNNLMLPTETFDGWLIKRKTGKKQQVFFSHPGCHPQKNDLIRRWRA